MNPEPLVSVYIPTKDRPKLLVRALSSIYLQTYQNIEVLVCDDGSETDLSAIKTAFSVLFERFVWIRNDVSLGVSAARNKLISVSSGDYITGLDDDDEFTPDRIESFVRSGLAEQYVLLSSRYLKCYSNTVIADRWKRRVITHKLLLNDNHVGNQVFTKKEYLLGVGGFEEDLNSRALEDYHLWIKMTKKYGNGFRMDIPTYKLYLNTHDWRKNLDRTLASKKLHLFFENVGGLTFRNRLNIKASRAIDGKYELSVKDYLQLIVYFCWYQLARICYLKLLRQT